MNQTKHALTLNNVTLITRLKLDSLLTSLYIKARGRSLIGTVVVDWLAVLFCLLRIY